MRKDCKSFGGFGTIKIEKGTNYKSSPSDSGEDSTEYSIKGKLTTR